MKTNKLLLMKKSFNFSKSMTTLSALLGLIYISTIIWSRLILTRLPKDLDGNYTDLQYISFSLLFIISIIIIFINMRKILNIQINPNSFYTKLLTSSVYTNIAQYILEAPKNLYHWLLQYIVIRDPIEYIGIKIWNMDPYKYNFYIICFLYSIRIFACILFSIDVFYYNKLEYFYKILPFFLFSVIFQGFLYILKDFSKMNKDYIEKEFLIIEPNENYGGFSAQPQDKYLDLTDNQIIKLTENWTAYLANCMFVDKCYEYQDMLSKYLLLFCYTTYAFGWGYILYNALFV